MKLRCTPSTRGFRILTTVLTALLCITVLLIPRPVSAAYRYGASGNAVYTLQQNLEGLGYGCTPDGVFGDETYSALLWYQSNKGLTVDGVAGNATLTRLGEDVMTVQRQLKALGYAPGSIDGIYGASTRSAVKAFQRDYSLTADGVAGSATRTKLSAAVAAGSASAYISTASSLSAFKSYIQSNWSSPLRVSYLPITGGRAFGYTRSDGRQHAGIDFYVENGDGTPVYAMTAGTVTGISRTFYAGTGAVTVQNADGSVLRYGEIIPAVSEGATVKKGQVIGYISANTADGGTMLHLELYRGTSSGSLSQDNSSYWYVSGSYNRRADLLNPSSFGIG